MGYAAIVSLARMGFRTAAISPPLLFESDQPAAGLQCSSGFQTVVWWRLHGSRAASAAPQVSRL